MDDVLAELSERGKVEWDLAAAKATLKKADQQIQDLVVENTQLKDTLDNFGSKPR